MKKSALLIALLLSFSAVLFSAAAPADVVGNWKGTLTIDQVRLRLLFKVTKAADGSLSAKLDSLDQGARDLAADSVTVANDSVRMDVKIIGGMFQGTLDKAGNKLSGQWTQGPRSMPLTLERVKGPIDVAEAETLTPAELASSKLAASKLAGTWDGTLSASAAELRLVLRITNSPIGAAIGFLDSPDQGVKDIPLSAISLTDGKLRFDARGIGGSYEGTLAANGAALSGDWKQGKQYTPLKFKKLAAKK